MDLVVVGINHESADLDVRERYAIPADHLPDRLRNLLDRDEIGEVVTVSTCNRVETYLMPAAGFTSAQAAGVARTALGPATKSMYTHAGPEAVQHLFRVSASLDSMVLGEPQILGQVKEAFAIARDAGTVGQGLDGTFRRAFRAAKRVRTETTISRSAVSVGYVAVELAKTIFGDIGNVSALLVGAGKMGILAAKNLADSGARRVQVANRTWARGKAVADRFGWSASAYSDLPILVGAVDVVICSTGSLQPVLTAEFVSEAVKRRRYRPLFLIDIAVPRDIEPACGDLSDVYLYNIDDLEEVSRSNAEGRREAADQAERIVVEEIEAWRRWRRERVAAPAIQRLREKAVGIATAEATKTLKMLPGLDSKGETAIKKLAEVVAMKLIRGPMTALKKEAGESDAMSAVVDELFGLDGGEE